MKVILKAQMKFRATALYLYLPVRGSSDRIFVSFLRVSDKIRGISLSKTHDRLLSNWDVNPCRFSISDDIETCSSPESKQSKAHGSSPSSVERFSLLLSSF
jgi:hypothetical protein